MTRAHVVEQLNAGHDWLVCAHHKTSKTYGDLAKWLSPGVVECLRYYDKLPRPEGCKLFFVPVRESAPVAPVPSYLKAFSKVYLPKKCEQIRVNLMFLTQCVSVSVFLMWYIT